jgi:hypothetical protein
MEDRRNQGALISQDKVEGCPKGAIAEKVVESARLVILRISPIDDPPSVEINAVFPRIGYSTCRAFVGDENDVSVNGKL